MKTEQISAVKAIDLGIEIERFLESKYGQKMTQDMVSTATSLQRAAVAVIPVDKLPKEKTGTSRTSPVYYKTSDVAHFILSRADIKGAI